MKKRFLLFACLCGFTLMALTSCEKSVVTTGAIYGVVTDMTTGELIRDAEVELTPFSIKAFTGSDGSFEFTELVEGTYYLRARKAGYKDYSSSAIDVSASSKMKMHSIKLEKLPSVITVVDDNMNEITAIEFGSDEGITMASFNIFNNSGETLEWQIQYQCDWISGFSKERGTLTPNKTQAITIGIERERLNDGENITTIQIVSSNNGSRQLTIKAVKNKMDLVVTTEITDITSTSAMLNGYLNYVSKYDVIQYGFVYTTSDNYEYLDIEYANGWAKRNLVTFSGYDVGSFFYMAENLEPGKTYYVRAYACVYHEDYLEYVYGEIWMFTTAEKEMSYYIKHPWGSGRDEDWTWKKMTREKEGLYMDGLGYKEGLYTYKGRWGGSGAYINTSASDKGAIWFNEEAIVEFDYDIGVPVMFIYDPETQTLEVQVQ